MKKRRKKKKKKQKKRKKKKKNLNVTQELLASGTVYHGVSYLSHFTVLCQTNNW
jgi:hypothetical protein